jgi:hypothetical protein
MLLGAWMMAAASGFVGMVEAFVLWLASIGAVVLVLGASRMGASPRTASIPVGLGGFLMILGLVSYFVLGDSMGLVMGFALMLVICAALVLVIYLTRYSLEKE